jgi:hypothetical protein
MTKAIRVATFVLALSIYAQAGIMQTGKEDPPPPPPPAAAATTQDGTEAEASPEGETEYDPTAAASQAMLNVLESLLILF